MSSTSGIELRGMEGLAKKLRSTEANATQGGRAGAYALANNIMTVAKERAPFDQGILAGSGYVSPPDAQHSVEIGFGGAAKSYAVRQHEDLTFKHTRGQAKYLESAVDEAGAGGLETIAGHIRLDLSVDAAGFDFVGAVVRLIKEEIGDYDEEKQQKAEKRRAR